MSQKAKGKLIIIGGHEAKIGERKILNAVGQVANEGIISIFNVKLHVLAEGNCFDLIGRQPLVPKEVEDQSQPEKKA